MQPEAGHNAGNSRVSAEQKKDMLRRYTDDTGVAEIVPEDVLAWLQPRQDEPLWLYFFGKETEELAHMHRVHLMRRMLGSLRVKFEVMVTDTSDVKRVEHRVIERSVPAFISPAQHRVDGSGYVEADLSSDVYWSDLLDEAATALAAWLKRYEAALERTDIEAGVVRDLHARLQRGVTTAS